MKFNEWISAKEVQTIADKAKLDISKFEIKQLIQGYKIELEHGKGDPETNVTNSDPVMTLKIAVAHLKEDPHYYTKLKKVEREGRP
jgi:hypothetical protein